MARVEGELGTVVQRDELARILLELASGNEPGGKALHECARAKLKRTLDSNGISYPAAVLENIHLLGMKLEGCVRNCWLRYSTRSRLLPIRRASFPAIHASLDATMDRITQRFARNTGIVVGVIAIGIAVGLQLDAFELQ